MRVDAFDFHLPEERIALRPVEPRDAARLLVVGPNLLDCSVSDLPKMLRPGDALVFNDTKVIPARLYGMRRRGEIEAKVEILLHRREDEMRWRVFAKPARKLKPGDLVLFGTLEALVEREAQKGEILLRFSLSGLELDDAIVAQGEMPLPPYIAAKRRTDARDAQDYQTIYANNKGSVAAPTAGLHFTPRLMEALKEAGISTHFVTLHVGAGTFLPVKAEDTAQHVMHEETGIISPDTAAALNEVKAGGGRILAVGTTSLRLLESAADKNGIIHSFRGETGIFITPGYRFRAIDGLMTNFHLPRSTLFMLVSALCGLEVMQSAYAHAIRAGYRFYSYGDACLLWPQT